MIIVAIVLVIALAIGVPVGYSFGLGSVLSVWFTKMTSEMATSVMFSSLDAFTLLAIPFFMLAGDLMKEGRISEKLVDWIGSFMSRIKADLLYVMVVVCIFFGAVSGSSVATVSAVGAIMLPVMEQRGYSKKISAALVAASGFIGILIPPSIPLVLYGVSANVSISRLFLSTVFPGLILAGCYMLVMRFWYVRKGFFDSVDPPSKYPDFKTAATTVTKSTLKGFPAIFMPVIILGGIYGGIFTPTEAAGVASLYSLLVGLFLYRGLNRKNLWKTIGGSAMTTAVLLFLVCFVSVFGRALLVEQVPQKIATFIIGITDNKYIILILVNLFLLVVGMFMDTNVAILILTPILLPIMTQVGVDPTQLGAILVLNLGIGMITPPFAANMFVAARVSGLPATEFIPDMMRLLLMACIPTLIITSYIPAVSLWLPNLVLGF